MPTLPAGPTLPHADTIRDDGRIAPRYQQIRRREPHEKYALTRGEAKKGMAYFWAATKIRGMPNPRFTDYWRAGWRPVEAQALPDLSGIDLGVPHEFVEMGIVREVKPDGPIIDGDLMLLTRPKEMSDAADREMLETAENQVQGWIQTLRGNSEKHIGRERTRISRRFERGEEAPSDSETEMG